MAVVAKVTVHDQERGEARDSYSWLPPMECLEAMYSLHPRLDGAHSNVVDVRNEEGRCLYTTDPCVHADHAMRRAKAWASWAENVSTGTCESIYYILSVPETWAGPAPGAHAYSGLHFKIGRSRDPLKRVKNLQTGASGDLIIHALEPGSSERERELHEMFGGERRSGEWFSASPQLMKHVFQTGQRNVMLPPEHQFKLLQLAERIGVYKFMRQEMGHAPDMVNPSLNEEWHGNVFIDLVYTKLLSKGNRPSQLDLDGTER